MLLRKHGNRYRSQQTSQSVIGQEKFWLLHCFYRLLQSLNINNKSELCIKWNVEVGSFIYCVWACRYIGKCLKDVENQLYLIFSVYCLDCQTQNFKVHIPRNYFSRINSSSGWTGNTPNNSWMAPIIFDHVTVPIQVQVYDWGLVPLTRAIVTKGWQLRKYSMDQHMGVT